MQLCRDSVLEHAHQDLKKESKIGWHLKETEMKRKVEEYQGQLVCRNLMKDLD